MPTSTYCDVRLHNTWERIPAEMLCGKDVQAASNSNDEIDTSSTICMWCEWCSCVHDTHDIGDDEKKKGRVALRRFFMHNKLCPFSIRDDGNGDDNI